MSPGFFELTTSKTLVKNVKQKSGKLNSQQQRSLSAG